MSNSTIEFSNIKYLANKTKVPYLVSVIIFVFLGGIGCEESRQSKEVEAFHQIWVSGESQSDEHLRVGVAIFTQTGFELLADEALIALETEQTIKISTPNDVMLADAIPQESLFSAFSDQDPVRAYRPRIFIYDDRDGDEAFSFDLVVADSEEDEVPLDLNADRVLAVDENGPFLTYIRNLDEFLSKLSFEDNAAYYRSTLGDYSSFVKTRSVQNILRLEDNRAAIVAPQVLNLDSSAQAGSAITDEALRCFRRPVSASGNVQSGTFRAKATVDPALGIDNFCGVLIEDCVEEALEPLDSPDTLAVLSGPQRQVAQCRKTSQHEVLIINRGVQECALCRCSLRLQGEVFATTEAAKPSWWPCGDSVAYCDSDLPLYVYDGRCELPQESE